MNIIYENIKGITPKKITEASRGIILKGNLILLTYSNHFEDYTTPGGRKENSESTIETLKRELKEELGVTDICYKPIGIILEYFKVREDYELKRHHYYLITNYTIGQANRQRDELIYGMESKWVSIDEAIDKNTQQINLRLKKGLNEDNPFITTMVRENKILSFIKEHYL
ncbi:MAG: NUDIX domain-containing protein [Acholeplasmataceae bacterium]